MSWKNVKVTGINSIEKLVSEFDKMISLWQIMMNFNKQPKSARPV